MVSVDQKSWVRAVPTVCTGRPVEPDVIRVNWRPWSAGTAPLRTSSPAACSSGRRRTGSRRQCSAVTGWPGDQPVSRRRGP